MSYLAIARKYRPSTFDEIVGQEHVTRTLRNAIANGRIHHAFLFTGARGVGKTTAARALARALNCQQGPTPEPCGECVSCREIGTGSSPDLIEIDGASNNSVDDVRELRDTVHYAPTRGQYRIYLVDEVHMLSKAAFNALLKTLEEPPAHVVFIFATTEPNKILDTILSRVQRFDFKRIPVTGVVDRLRDIATAEGAQLSDEGLRMIARAGEGSMRDAQSLLDKVISFGGPGSISDQLVAETLGLIDRGLLHAMLEGMVQGRPDRCLDAIASVYDYGYELSQFTGELLELLRNATFVRLSEEARRHLDAPTEEIEQLEALTDGVEPEALSRLFTALLEVHDQVSRASRPRIVLEMAVARLATRRPVQPVGALLARLEDLERRLRQTDAPGARPGLRTAEPRRTRTEPRSGASRAPRVQAARRSAPDEDDVEGSSPEPAARAGPPVVPAPVAEKPAERCPPPERAAPPAVPPPPTPDAAPEAAAERRWEAFRAALGELEGPAARLAQGEPDFRDGVLRIAVPAGRPLAEARRAVADERVAELLAREYPPGTAVEVVPQSGTGTAADREQALRREVLADPAAARILRGLSAEIERVVPLRGTQESNDGL